MSDPSSPTGIDKPNPRPDGSDGGSAKPAAVVTRHGVTISVDLLPEHSRLLSGRYGHRSFAEAWSEFWEVDPPACPVLLREGATWPKTRRSTPAHLTSLLFHISVVYFCYSVPFSDLFHRFLPPQEVKNTHMNVVAIEFHGLSLPPRLPDLRPPDLGGAPGQGEKPEAKPRLGVTHFDPRVSIISNPAHPDNLRFTVHNPAVPPTLKLPKDLRVPNLILGSLTPLPQPPPAPPKLPKPAPPAPHAEPPTAALKPKLVLPPDLVPLTELDLASKLPPIPAPHLEVQAGPSPPPAKNATPPGPEVPVSAAPTPETNTANAASPDGEKHPGTAQLTTLSIDPIPLKDMPSIPAGNAEGAFAIGPAGGGPGSPGGVPGGELGAGKGGPGLGGDKSVAVGKGGAGGGGAPGSVTPAGSLSVTNLTGGPGGAAGGTLPPLDVQSLVYPVNPADSEGPGDWLCSEQWGGGWWRTANLRRAAWGEGLYGLLDHAGQELDLTILCSRRNPKARARFPGG